MNEQLVINTLNKTAIVIGATGLIGKQLLIELILSPDFNRIKVFTRRTLNAKHPKLEEIIINFDHPETWEKDVSGDVLFSTLGTTIKKAGTKEKQYKVDYTYQYLFAKKASENKVSNYVLVSSTGANSKSPFFYTRMKGELEDAVKQLPFKKIIILQPSILEGNREERRNSEFIALLLTKFFTKFIFRKYKPSKDRIVAKAMVEAVSDDNIPARATYSLNEIDKLAENNQN